MSLTLALALIMTALLFGGMVLYSFGFAAFLFSAMPAAGAGPVLRQAFPWFYGFVIVAAATAALLWWPHNLVFAWVLATIALTTLPLRQVLMPAINRATDAGQRQRFKVLHSVSVLATLGHITALGWLWVVVAGHVRAF